MSTTISLFLTIIGIMAITFALLYGSELAVTASCADRYGKDWKAGGTSYSRYCVNSHGNMKGY